MLLHYILSHRLKTLKRLIAFFYIEIPEEERDRRHQYRRTNINFWWYPYLLVFL